MSYTEATHNLLSFQLAELKQLQDLAKIPHNYRGVVEPDIRNPYWDMASIRFGGKGIDHISDRIVELRRCINRARSERKARDPDTFRHRLDERCLRVNTAANSVFWGDEGRSFDIHVRCSIPSFMDEMFDPKVSFPSAVDEGMRVHSPKRKVSFYIKPSWGERVGKKRAVLTITGEKAFVVDAVEFDNPDLNERGVKCFKVTVFGKISKPLFGHLKNRLITEYQDAMDSDDMETANQVQEDMGRLRDNYDGRKGIQYQAYYLESQRFTEEDGRQLHATGVTFKKTASLFDRRLKDSTAKVLIDF